MSDRFSSTSLHPEHPEQPGQGPVFSVPRGNRILAIDGPAGAGKSTIANRMARRFNLLNLETGAMYRAFALKAIQGRTALDHEAELIRLSHITSIELNPSPHGNRVLLDGQDVTSQLRTPQISEGASRVSVHGPIRAWMVALQQAMGRKLPAGTAGLVMEGRDIGTVVFPEASIKVFLSASAEARTQRRLAQSATQPEIQPPIQSQIQTQTGSRARPSDVPLSPAADPIAVLAAMRERDTRDQTRSESPLRPAEDAILIDSTHLGLEDVVAQVGSLVVSRWGL